MVKFSSSIWTKSEKGEYVYRTTLTDTDVTPHITITDESPEGRGYSKKVIFYVIFHEKVESGSRRKKSEKEVFYKQRFTATIKDADNIFILLGDDKRYYLRDLEPANLGTTIQMPLSSNANVKIETSEEQECSVEEAREILGKWKYFFADSSEEQGETIFRIDVRPY